MPGMKLLYIVNTGSGNNQVNHEQEIRRYFSERSEDAEIFVLPDECNPDQIRNKIDTSNADRVIAVGGDGTIKLVAEALLGSERAMGILPAGSANGLAKELGIPLELSEALALSCAGKPHPIHVTLINDHLCIHLSDIGFNAFVVKKFEAEKKRGMWGYVRAAFITLMKAPRMNVSLEVNGEKVERDAAMVVIANGTRYGSGAVINPLGRIDDAVFEIVLVRKISFNEIFKMMFTHRPYDERKTEVFQTADVRINARHKAHFQVDGEYLGKIREIRATLHGSRLHVILPDPEILQPKIQQDNKN